MRHVLDLAPLYKHPSSNVLLETLGELAVRPATFDGRDDTTGEEDMRIAEEGVPRYLTSIIGSSLAWIEDDAVKETIWELASQRLSERSGRTAQPSFKRTFKIPRQDPQDILEIQLHEPSLTEDNLGHKTWASAYLLAKQLPALIMKIPSLKEQAPSNQLPSVLELGAGTGLTGLSLAMLRPCIVHLTDLPSIVPNLASNAKLNEDMIMQQQPRSEVRSFVLDWSMVPTLADPEYNYYDVIIAADPLYSPEHPKMVVQVISACLKRTAASRVVVELPLREAYVQERLNLKQGLEAEELVLLEHGEESGYDDWGDGGTEVDCWWGVWGWRADLP